MLCCAAGLAVADEKNILVTGGSDRAIPIAVVPFGWQGGTVLPEDLSTVIGNDLRNSGMYAPIPRQNMISLPTSAAEIIYRDWQALGAQYVMVGSIVPNGGRLQVQFALFNVTTQQQVVAGTVGGTPDQLRDMAHHIADQAFEKLTGIKGAFSTKMLYVTAERFGVNNTRYTLQRSDYDGARGVTLLQSREPILSPRYAPDGRRIAYVSFEQRRPRIFLQHIDTGRREQLTNFEGLNGAPAFSPDGNRLAFVLSKDGNPEIYVMDLGSRQIQRVTNSGSIETEPFWGKDGQTLYFTSDRAGKPQIYKQSIHGGNAERVTFTGNYNANPKLSADEKTLVMIHRQDGFTNFKVAAQDLVTSRLRILSETSLDDSPTVAPNGTMLIYATRQQGRGVLMLVSTNGRVRLPIPTAQGDVREPSWSPFLN
ncbi:MULTISPECIES: Tol-Pal system beta propeller repeat protein TolB [Pseudomonas]|jgi:TolB protein|uniref:Tol-Pal system beta propeller repeat protein TolB n=1 Tax=Pseudomonas TaxID=286 RepID=UPI001C81883A|nr:MULTISPECIES: Tol-Pal system beta propeller repeat protein TolB [Pseudomonas]MDG9930799.1 Tol-Pal system beta propeller repeat protein TolB [Pseudomonas sp. GD04042]MDH0485188.1 Tol-Pal system beta propeller repeat protein TolB [Pseudomonas sp. GD04015]MDH0605558.1 Tol-Pal system beta propeller repeat protein TolB [Pseudomonas sp. GD03869]MDH0893820.1 Tol-Pal system beta propeller repeat protein TolB [Pseudomonas sp. GD03875]MDH1064339.1 Tol-Pal system beta propeller repeat protein TolB [Ps